MKKRNFSAEFKREFAQLVVDQNYTVADAAKAMDVGLSTMTRWVKCHVFGLHRSSYRYWKNRPEKPDGRRAVLRSQVVELHGISHGSAGARSIATIAIRSEYQMRRWLAGRLMKELGLVSCQQPTHRYKRGGHEHVAILNYLRAKSGLVR